MRNEPQNATNLVAGNVGSRYLSMAVTMVLGFVLTPYLIRAVGKPAYGLQSLSHQALHFITMAVAAIGISYDRLAAAQYARGELDRMNATLSAGLTLSTLGAALVLLGTALLVAFADILFRLPPELASSARWVLGLCGVGAACHIINKVYSSPVFITKRLYIEAFGSLLAGVAAAALVIPLFVWLGPSIIIWVALSIGARVLSQWFFTIPLARRGLPGLRLRLFAPGIRREMPRLVSFGGLAFVGGVGNLLYFATDSIIISNLPELGIAQVANYNVAARWYPQILMLATGFIGVWGPVMTAHAATERLTELRRTVRATIRHAYAILALPCLLLFLYAEPFLRHWLKGVFPVESVAVMRLMMGSLLVSGMGFVGRETLFACHRIKGFVVATLVGGVLNIALSIGLARYAGLGLTGIALGSALALLIPWVLFAPLALRRHTGMGVGLLLLAGLRGMAGAVPLLATALWLQRVWPPGSLLEVFAQFALCTLVYLPAVWWLALPGEDRAAVWQAVRSVPRIRGASTDPDGKGQA